MQLKEMDVKEKKKIIFEKPLKNVRSQRILLKICIICCGVPKIENCDTKVCYCCSKMGKNSIKPNQQKLDDYGRALSIVRDLSKPELVLDSEVRVKKWADCSSKYGLGYILSNGAIGVIFNDCTKMIIDKKGLNVEYIEKRTTEKLDAFVRCTLHEYPKILEKKIILLKHFRSHLETKTEESVLTNSFFNAIFIKNILTLQEASNTRPAVIYVKKWIKSKHAIMFRLSNKNVQLRFIDGTEIILRSQLKMVTYTNKKGERSNHPLATALESGYIEMIKRLNYTTEILTFLFNNNK